MRQTKEISIHFLFIASFVAVVVSTDLTNDIERRTGRCILPPYPNNGYYEVAGDPYAKPGDEPKYIYLNVSCYQNHVVIGNNVMLCILGERSTTMPQCVPTCLLLQHDSVEYRCSRPGQQYTSCDKFLPEGSSVKAICREGFYHEGRIPLMRCVHGNWTNLPMCIKDCGRVYDSNVLPWYAYIYKERQVKKSLIISPICAGSIINKNQILTAAHCFWNSISSEIITEGYIVTVGKKQLSWNNEDMIYRVIDVKTPTNFRGQETNYQSDLALVTVASNFDFSSQVLPVCIDFDSNLRLDQLQEGNYGMLSIWNDTFNDNTRLQVKRLPFMPAKKCLYKSPTSFREYMSVDKFCAGHDNGTKICQGNSGAGLSFPEEMDGIKRHYLRGIVSVSPASENKPECQPSPVIGFTDIYSHQTFIKEYISLY